MFTFKNDVLTNQHQKKNNSFQPDIYKLGTQSKLAFSTSPNGVASVSKLDRTADETKHEITPIDQKVEASPPQASNISDQELEDNLRNVLQSFDVVDQ